MVEMFLFSEKINLLICSCYRDKGKSEIPHDHLPQGPIQFHFLFLVDFYGMETGRVFSPRS